MTGSRRIGVAYLIALVVSRLWITWGVDPRSGEFELPEDMRATKVRVLAKEGDAPESARLAYRALGTRSAESVVLLHGSPGSLQDFATLGEQLGPDRSILIPDMLGFGHSTRSVPDHSFVAQADALAQLLDQEGVERVHLVGFSWGGGVAIEFLRRSPERVASLVMVSAIGVQELELLGRFELNRLVHGFQHGIFVALDWGLPHFGLLTWGPLSSGFTRSFLDSDQRPARETLEQYTGPMLVLHGSDDFLVPPAAAREHHRIVPQSEIAWVEGGHLVLWSHRDEIVAALRGWFERADALALPSRSDATAARRSLAEKEFDRRLAGPQNGLGWLIFFLLVFVASMVSEDLTCAGVGLLVATGQVGFWGGVAACIFALVVGDVVLYAGGRLVGPPLLRRFGRSPSEVGAVGERLRASGGWGVLFGRFIPGARLPTYVAAGIIGYPFLRFSTWLILAAALWAPLLVGVTALGGRALDMDAGFSGSSLVAAVALILFIALAARFVPQLVTYRGRRLLLARLRRLMRWEFWPIWAIYGPLVPSLARMALRHRSIRLPTLVNPSIPGGGLAGESKVAIGKALEAFPEHGIETEVVEVEDASQGADIVKAWMDRVGVNFPVVLKPDVGERGRGVLIARDEASLSSYFDSAEGRVLAQAFVIGEEYGLFYIRQPDAETGEVFSLARKVPRTVEGNGVDSLERLILEDPICLPMAKTLLELNRGRLEEIPGPGDRVPVTEIGTHSLGCRFMVGEDLRTREIEEAVDRLSQGGGLDFGRYDVKAEDEAALMRGEFKVIEFNGLTGEAAHMYDPRYGVRAGLRILRAQWEHAFVLGAGHRAAGRRPLSWAALWQLVRDSRE